jgi:hypothetical protein
LPKEQRRNVAAAIDATAAAWGQPHLHRGIGIRRLTDNVFECRSGLDNRLVFVFIATPPELVFVMMGNHDEIRAFIRSL